MVVFKENATSDVMASGSVRTAPEPTVNRGPPRILRKVRKMKIMASFENTIICECSCQTC